MNTVTPPLPRPRLIVGNWKMNLLWNEALALGTALRKALEHATLPAACQLVVAPPCIYLASLAQSSNDHPELPQLQWAAQDCHQATHGAFTGNIAARMLAALSVQYVLVGHSERRQQHGETDALIAHKVRAALAAGLRPIVCCGEPAEERAKQRAAGYVIRQVNAALEGLPAAQLAQVVLAYEPIWAIGSGKAAAPEQAQAMHHLLRQRLVQHHGEHIAAQIPLLYGGSCTAENAGDLLSCPDIDGALVGGASLCAASFLAIARQL